MPLDPGSRPSSPRPPPESHWEKMGALQEAAQSPNIYKRIMVTNLDFFFLKKVALVNLNYCILKYRCHEAGFPQTYSLFVSRVTLPFEIGSKIQPSDFLSLAQ